jgi:30S ribosomal protein S31
MVLCRQITDYILKNVVGITINLIKLKKEIMGRGDIKTKKGKIFSGSFGKTRPAKPAKKVVAPKKKAAAKKK